MSSYTVVFFLILTFLTNLSFSSKVSSLSSFPISEKPLNSDFDHDPSTFEDTYKELRTLDSISGGSSGSFIKKRLYNTSIALTASMFTYHLPPRTQPGAVLDLVNQAIYGLFAMLGIVLIFGVPVLIAGIRETVATARSLTGFEMGEDEENWITNHLMNMDQVKYIFNQEVRDQIGLDEKKCLQKIICEAHRSPKNKKFGLITLPFQMFYPPPEKETSKARGSSYQTAAATGKYSKEDCAKKYNCLFDVLDLFAFLIDWYRLSNDPEYVPKESDFY